MKKAFLIAAIVLTVNAVKAQWYYTNLMASINAVTFVNSSTGFASSGFTLAKTTDSGTNWSFVAGAPMDSIFTGISFPSQNTGYAVGLGGNMVKTTDGGNTWTHLSTGTGKNLFCVFFTDENTGYIAGDGNALRKTTDGGMTWQQLQSPAGTIFSMYFTSSTFGIIAGNTRSIYRTQDGGANWLEIAFSSPKKFMSVHFPNAMTGYACGQIDALTPCMIKSTDGGMKWSEVPINTGLGLDVVYFRDDNQGYAAGAGGTIIRTNDGGATWGKQSTPDLGTIHALWFTDANHGFAGGAALLRTDNGGGTAGIQGHDARKPITVQPNPASERITIAPGTNPVKGHLTIVDQSGKKVLEQEGQEFPFTLNVSAWVPGIYLVLIDSDQTSFAGKFIKQ
jgi:photosystem II stability/assembly factor-like uncharacterized protein